MMAGISSWFSGMLSTHTIQWWASHSRLEGKMQYLSHMRVLAQTNLHAWFMVRLCRNRSCMNGAFVASVKTAETSQNGNYCLNQTTNEFNDAFLCLVDGKCVAPISVRILTAQSVLKGLMAMPMILLAL